ncbi:MAG: DUF6516 family protein [Gallionella sp.]|nr:DUF6516 family protein [Gallionella sp.]
MNSKATLLYREKRSYAGGIIEMIIWQVPEPVPPSEHPYKYRFVFVPDNQRLVGYDNERGKGDHKHIDDLEVRYQFVNEAQLLEDFWRDVQEATK